MKLKGFLAVMIFVLSFGFTPVFAATDSDEPTSDEYSEDYDTYSDNAEVDEYSGEEYSEEGSSDSTDSYADDNQYSDSPADNFDFDDFEKKLKNQRKTLLYCGYTFFMPWNDMKDYLNYGHGFFVGYSYNSDQKGCSAPLNMDFTYVKYLSKNKDDSYDYMEFANGLNWHFLKVFEIGLGSVWNIILVKIPRYNYDQASIRLGLYGQAGLSIPLFSDKVRLMANSRYRIFIPDDDLMPNGSGLKLRITQNTFSFYGGIAGVF